MSTKIVLDYLRDRYNEEQDRFKHLEDKSSRFLSFLSVVVGGIVALGGIKSGFIFHPKSELGWVALITYLLAGFCLMCSWGHAMLSVRIDNCPILPKNPETAYYLLCVENEEQEKHIYQCYVDTLHLLSIFIDDKFRNLELSYQELIYGASLLSISIISLTILEFSK